MSGGEDPGLFPTAGTIPTMPPLAAVVDPDGWAACAVDVEFCTEINPLDPGTGSESNAVSGGDEPGLLPMAGTMPTMPASVEPVGLGPTDEPPLFTAELRIETVMEVVGPASCGLSSDAAIVASGLPLGSTNVMSPVGIAAFLWPPPPPPPP